MESELRAPVGRPLVDRWYDTNDASESLRRHKVGNAYLATCVPDPSQVLQHRTQLECGVSGHGPYLSDYAHTKAYDAYRRSWKTFVLRRWLSSPNA